MKIYANYDVNESGYILTNFPPIMNKMFLGYLLLQLTALPTQAQTTDFHGTWTNDLPIDIQHISIENTDLKLFIKKYIRDRIKEDSLFRQNYGYITLTEITSNPSAQAPLDITQKPEGIENYMNAKVLSFAISIESHPFTTNLWEGNCWRCDYYPPFYTMIDGRLILIYDEVIQNIISTNGVKVYTKKSREELIKIVDPFLQKSLDPDFVFNELGFKKQYQISEAKRSSMTKHDIYKQAVFTFDALERYNLLRNGKVEKKTATP